MPDEIMGFSGASNRTIRMTDRQPVTSELTFTLSDGSTMMISSIDGITYSQPIREVQITDLPQVPKKRTKKQVTKPTPDVWDQI